MGQWKTGFEEFGSFWLHLQRVVLVCLPLRDDPLWLTGKISLNCNPRTAFVKAQFTNSASHGYLPRFTYTVNFTHCDLFALKKVNGCLSPSPKAFTSPVHRGCTLSLAGMPQMCFQLFWASNTSSMWKGWGNKPVSSKEMDGWQVAVMSSALVHKVFSFLFSELWACWGWPPWFIPNDEGSTLLILIWIQQ